MSLRGFLDLRPSIDKSLASGRPIPHRYRNTFALDELPAEPKTTLWSRYLRQEGRVLHRASHSVSVWLAETTTLSLSENQLARSSALHCPRWERCRLLFA
jgi:hypothetical protein